MSIQEYNTKEICINWDPGITALYDDMHAIDYMRLFQVCGKLGQRLIELGMHDNEVVAVIGGRGIPTILCLYALAHVGAAFLTLPTPPPGEWLTALGSSGKVQFALIDLLCGIEGWEDSWTVGERLSTLDPAFPESWVVLRSKAPFAPQRQRSERLAYVLTTSGSTGLPKSVEISTSAFNTKINDLLQIWASPPGMKWLNWHHYSFDASLLEVFGCLRSGGSLFVPDDGTASSADLLAEVVIDQQPASAFLTPTEWRALKKSLGERVWAPKRLILGGEALTTEEVREWATPLAQFDMEIWNAYGPTEVTICATAGRIWPPLEPWQGANIGRLLPNALASIRPLSSASPDAERGELILGGPSIASGYGAWLFPVAESDSSRFSEGTDGRWYATGDIVQCYSDASFEFIGRQDRQVKVEGVRIELDAIEAIARRLSFVRTAYTDVVCNANGRKGIALAIVVDQENSEVDAALRRQVRKILGDSLPRQHMPIEVTVTRTLQMTSSGKLDRRSILKIWNERGWTPA